MSKVTVIGAGMVGATCANVLAARNVADEVVLIDIKEGLSEGKMLDMYQAAATTDSKVKMVGCTNDYKKTANSDVVVVTSGIPRKPGMTREELIGTNANIVKSVVSQALAHSPRAIFVIVSNPMDTMAYLTLKSTGLPKNRVIGMGGALDSSRFRCYLAKAANANIHDVDGMVIGGHGDTTMNIPSNLKYSNDHEWCRVEGEFAYVGITDFAQSQLGDIVFVDVPTVGETLAAGEVFGSIEAVKTVSDAFIPVGGEVVEFNDAVDADPALVNSDPYGEGWMIKVKMSNPADYDSLLTPEAYAELIG